MSNVQSDVSNRRTGHDMPFGAQAGAAGTRFRLWAPGARRVELGIRHDGTETLQTLTAADGGWYEFFDASAGHGTRYRYRIDGSQWVPDPASRFNPDGVHGASEVVDPRQLQAGDAGWTGRPWHETVLYELHVGTFTPEGTYRAAAARLDYLADLGVTAVELMPVASFRGSRGWGYDGVLPYAPHPSYGSPAELRGFIEAAHARGLMVFLDVVYNHFGPEGNYLHLYAPQFFARDNNDWGSVIDFSQRPVRDFFIHNALYWLEEYRFDGLRFDAVEAIVDRSDPDIMSELAAAVHAGPGKDRHVHLVQENYFNRSRYLRRRADRPGMWFDAQWNDDFHHAAHVLVTGEQGGYYADYTDDPAGRLARCLVEGFCYQGDPSRYKPGLNRGEPSADLSPSCFVDFVQNHDQVGNRALGERITMLAPAAPVRAVLGLLLLSPSPPLLFMGEEFAADTPFLFFCDFDEQLAAAVREGRARQFPAFHPGPAGKTLPDPNAPSTFEASRLRWASAAEPPHKAWLDLYRRLLQLRARSVVPFIPLIEPGSRRLLRDGPAVFRADWPGRDGRCLSVRVNLAAERASAPPRLAGETLYSTREPGAPGESPRLLPGWSVEWVLGARPE